MTTPADFLAKMDWEGYEGITWFGPADFDDDELAELVERALNSYIDFTAALDDAESRARTLVDEVNEQL